MHVIIGTIPDDDLPVTIGKIGMRNSKLEIDGIRLDIDRGTPAMASAACQTSKYLNREPPTAIFAGDTGCGEGSRALYAWLEKNIAQFNPTVITFHYILPDNKLHNRVLDAILKLQPRPILIADAGYMYVAKMSGHAPDYDLFTPDAGELAFLADELAPHPFYTRGFILHDGYGIEEKIARAYEYKNAAKVLIVKGSIDYVVSRGRIVEKISEPCIEALEPIGGTGDTLTGIVSALAASGKDLAEASILACRVNRIAGQLANPTPATRVCKLIEKIPDALKTVYNPS